MKQEKQTKSMPSSFKFQRLLVLLALSLVVLLVSLLTPLLVFTVDIVIITFGLLELIRKTLFMSSLKGRESLLKMKHIVLTAPQSLVFLLRVLEEALHATIELLLKNLKLG